MNKKIIIKDTDILKRIDVAEGIYNKHLLATLLSGVVMLLISLTGVKDNDARPLLAGFAFYFLFGLISHLYYNFRYKEWDPFKHIIVPELAKSGYRYSHWNKFYKDGKAWHCSYANRVKGTNSREVEIREWTNADNGEA